MDVCVSDDFDYDDDYEHRKYGIFGIFPHGDHHKGTRVLWIIIDENAVFFIKILNHAE